MIIDAHQHFWKYSPQKHAWIRQEMSLLKRDFLPDDLQKIFAKNQVAACVAVQAEQSEEETGFLLQLADQYNYIKGVVGWVDLKAENLLQRLDYYQDIEKLKGFRHQVQDEPDPRFMLHPAFQNGLRVLEKTRFTFDLLVYPVQLDATLQTGRNFPRLSFVLDHMAKPDIKSGSINNWSTSIQQIAKEPHVYCKISGMVTEASWKDWKAKDFSPYLDVVFQAFGPDRLMFGSDWPVCLLAADYQAVLDIVIQYTRNLPEEDKQKIFYKNAQKFYKLTQP